MTSLHKKLLLVSFFSVDIKGLVEYKLKHLGWIFDLSSSDLKRSDLDRSRTLPGSSVVSKISYSSFIALVSCYQKNI